MWAPGPVAALLVARPFAHSHSPNATQYQASQLHSRCAGTAGSIVTYLPSLSCREEPSMRCCLVRSGCRFAGAHR